MNYVRQWLWRLQHGRAVSKLLQGMVGGYTFRDFVTHSCIFVHIPRTGGVAVARALFGHLAGGHRSINEYRLIFGRRLDGFFKFTFVRDPVDRLASAYYFLKGGGFDDSERRWARRKLYDCNDFNTFCERRLRKAVREGWVHFRQQWRFVCDHDGKIVVDFVGRFETLAADFDQVSRQLGISAVLKPENQSSRPRRVNTGLSKAARDIVYESYRRDFELFGYHPPE